MKRKHLLFALGAPILVGQWLLVFVDDHDNLGYSGSVFNLALMVLIAATFVQGMRGRSSNLSLLAWLYALLGCGSVVAAFFVPNGPIQLAAYGVLSVALAVVFLMLRDEVRTLPDARWSSSRTQEDQEPVAR
jgi:hypothetical protein